MTGKTEEDRIVEIAQEHGGRYLITLSAWLDKGGPTRQVCERLVAVGRARWLAVKRPGENGEPGPGIELVGRDRGGVMLRNVR